MMMRALSAFMGRASFSFIAPSSLMKSRKLFYQSTSNLLDHHSFLDLISHNNKNKTHQPISIYCGYDPTSNSLHLGNLVSIIMMTRLHWLSGLRPIFLLGGATGLIGDPSGKKQERVLLDEEHVQNNLKSINSEIKQIYCKLSSDIEQNHEEYGLPLNKTNSLSPLFINNHDFYRDMNILHFLRDIGKKLRMGSLLNKQIIANRLSSENGLSYTQFSYSILQAYDFYVLNQKYGCSIQLGGSDQWGNITNGCDLVRRFTEGQADVFGMTMPLLLSKTGEKFGKSQGNALFLNSEKTPLSAVYDYFFSTADEDIEKLLYIFTFYSAQKIDQIMKNHKKQVQKRSAQRILAQKVTRILGNYRNLKEDILKLSSPQLHQKTLKELQGYFKQLPNDMKFDFSLNEKRETGEQIKDLPDFLNCLKIANTKKEARRDIEGNGIYLNNGKISKDYVWASFEKVLEKHLLQGRFILVKKGKKKCYLIRFI